MTITPLGDRVLIELEAEDEIVAGLVIVRDQKNKPGQGVVLAVGPTAQTPQIRVGARVVFPRYAGHEFTIEGGRLVLMLDAQHILGVIPIDATELPDNVVPLTPRDPGHLASEIK